MSMHHEANLRRLDAAGYQTPAQRDCCKRCVTGTPAAAIGLRGHYVKCAHPEVRSDVPGGGWCRYFVRAVR